MDCELAVMINLFHDQKCLIIGVTEMKQIVSDGHAIFTIWTHWGILLQAESFIYVEQIPQKCYSFFYLWYFLMRKKMTEYTFNSS